MADNKKYYYMRLKENFFDSPELKTIESMRGGYKYSNILLKLYLLSLRDGGRLTFKQDLPYDTNMLSKLTGFSKIEIENALKIFKKFKLIEVLDTGTIYMMDIQTLIGKSSNEADRQREYQAKIASEKQSIMCKKSNKESNEISTPEIEIEIEKEIELDKEKDNKNISLELKDSKQNTFISLPLVTGSGNYDVTFDYLNSLRELFPALDVEQEFRSMAAWLDSHPRNRKTPRGIKRFITGWLERSQNSMPASRTPQAPAATKNMSTNQYMEATAGWCEGMGD